MVDLRTNNNNNNNNVLNLYIPVIQSKCTNGSNFYCWGAGSLPSAVLMVAESMYSQLKCNNITAPLDCEEKCLSSSEQHTWGQASSYFPPALLQPLSQPQTETRNSAAGSSGDRKAQYVSWIPAQPFGDSWPASPVRRFLLPSPPTAL